MLGSVLPGLRPRSAACRGRRGICSRSGDHRRGFTLVELLVVVAVIALLGAILLPSLSRARATSRFAVCGSNLRQLGCGVHGYAVEHSGYIPRGPEAAGADPAVPDFAGNRIATNQLWLGNRPWYAPTQRRRYHGLGPLMRAACPDPKVYFCPADDNFNLETSAPRIGSDDDAYGSYTYRQLDHLPGDVPPGVLDRMGANNVAGVAVPVEVLALDTNSLGPEALRAFHTNHAGRAANVLFRDASVRRFANRDNCLALPAEAFAGFPAQKEGVASALDQLLTNADYAYRGGYPFEAPRLAWP